MAHYFSNYPDVLLKELWLEYVDQERLQYDEQEVLSLWEKVQSEPTFLQNQNLGFTDYSCLSNGMYRCTLKCFHRCIHLVWPHDHPSSLNQSFNQFLNVRSSFC